MAKDHRYKVVKRLIEAGDIKAFQEIFNFIPKRVVYESLGLNYAKFQRLYSNPDLFTMRELVALAGHIECDPFKLFEMVISKPGAKKKARTKK